MHLHPIWDSRREIRNGQRRGIIGGAYPANGDEVDAIPEAGFHERADLLEERSIACGPGIASDLGRRSPAIKVLNGGAL